MTNRIDALFDSLKKRDERVLPSCLKVRGMLKNVSLCFKPQFYSVYRRREFFSGSDLRIKVIDIESMTENIKVTFVSTSNREFG